MRSKYNELLQERADLVKEAKALFHLCDDEERELTANERKADDLRDLRLGVINAGLNEMDVERAREVGLPGEYEVTGDSGGLGTVQRGPGPAYQPQGGRTYRDLFGGAPSLGAWKGGEDFFAAVHSGLADPRLIQATSTVGAPAEGGFLVPDQLVAEMLDASLEDEIVRPRAHVVPMTSATRKVSGFDAGTASGSTLFGGFTGQWVPETGIITAETPQLRQIVLNAKKLALLAQASNEVIADGMSFEEGLQAAIAKACGWFLDDAFLTGSGAGQPLGLLNDPALIAVAKETGQTAATIQYENLTKMFARMHPSCRQNSVWVANNTCIPQLAELSILIGAGGAFIPAMTNEGGQFIILTRPVLFTEKLAALGAKGDIVLADFSQYYVGLRQGMSIAKSQHLGFATDTSYYRGILRADGMGKWSAPYTPKTGDSMSWAVALEARA